MYACNGILFNHESPRRGETFVTRKITRGLSRIALGVDKCLYLGNLDALRDWGHARDYVEMQWLMLQQDQAEDFVIATGNKISVREFLVKSAENLGIHLEFEGDGINEFGYVADLSENSVAKLNIGDIIVKVDPNYYRPSEVETLLGSAKKAQEKLGWQPKISIDDMVSEMISSDLKDAEVERLVREYKS